MEAGLSASEVLEGVAALPDCEELVAAVVQQLGADPAGSTGEDKDDMPVFGAVGANCVAGVRALLKHGLRVEQRSPKSGTSALWLAAEIGYAAVCVALLDAGAEVDSPKLTTGTSPLFIASQNGHEDVCIELLGRGACRRGALR